MAGDVFNWLKRSKGIEVQENWLQACLDWARQEEGDGLPVARLREIVYEQWLHADLRDVVGGGCGLLPQSVQELQVTTVTGHFVLQVESVIDVGAAAYSQLQKLKGQSLDEVDTKKNFEPKPTRLLLLALTDGVTELQAMEYQPVPQLTTSLTPGSKIVLRGSIVCRLGTLLLKSENVEIMGGGVESLVHLNSQRNLLSRALNIDTEEEDERARNTATPAAEDSAVMTTNIQQNAGVGSVGPGGRGRESLGAAAEFDDMDLENFDDFEEMDDVGFEDGQEQWPNDVDFSPTTSMEDEGDDGGGGGGGGGEERGFDSGRGGAGGGGAVYNSSEGGGGLRGGGGRSDSGGRGGEGAGGEAVYYRSSGGEGEGGGGGESDDGGCRKGRRGGGRGGGGSSVQQHTSQQRPSFGIKHRRLSSTLTTSPTDNVEPTDKLRYDIPGPSGLETTADQRDGEFETKRKRGSAVAAVVPIKQEESGDTMESYCNSRSMGSVPVVNKFSDTAGVWRNYPLVRIKARFVRVTSKLTPSDGQWRVAVKVGDDCGGLLNVTLSNQVLERLIGFTAREFREHIQPNQKDAAVRARGSKGFKHCQSYLANLNCVMEIRRPSTFGGDPTVERLLDE